MLPETHQLNVEWLFLTIYNLIFGGEASVNFDAFAALIAEIWVWIIYLGYAVSVIALFAIVYCTIRLFDLRQREHHFYTTLITDPNAPKGAHPRWAHVQSLMQEQNSSRWREAILEADIMLDEVLQKEGYAGESVGERLKEAHFATLQDAWEGHKIRNQIAHQGSGFDLSHTLAQRALAHYEAVFRELGAI